MFKSNHYNLETVYNISMSEFKVKKDLIKNNRHEKYQTV